VKRAPPIANLKVTAFKPRMRGDFVIDIGGQQIGCENLSYRLHPDGRIFGLEVFLDADLNEEMRGRIGFIALDVWLGEYDVATGLSWIEFKPGRPADAQPIEDLPQDFDSRKPQVAN
jgi:hypothetical protein